jgi:presenilin-like A22 family membrane protease
MGSIGRTTPAVLALIVLAAHFYRAEAVVPAIVCVAAIALVFLRRPWPVLIVRLGLSAGSVLWLITAWRIAQSRMNAGMPYFRMLAILGAVAAFTAFAAWILPGARES